MKKFASKLGSELHVAEDGKYTFKMSQKEWEMIGKTAGYNGNLVMEWTGLSQKPLGEFLQWMTQFNIPLEDTKQFVLLKKAEYELQNI